MAAELALQNIAVWDREAWDLLCVRTHIYYLHCVCRLHQWPEFLCTSAYILSRLATLTESTAAVTLRVHDQLISFLHSTWCRPTHPAVLRSLLHRTFEPLGSLLGTNEIDAEASSIPDSIAVGIAAELSPAALVSELRTLFRIRNVRVTSIDGNATEPNVPSPLHVGDLLELELEFESRFPSTVTLDSIRIVFSVDDSTSVESIPTWACQTDLVQSCVHRSAISVINTHDYLFFCVSCHLFLEQ